VLRRKLLVVGLVAALVAALVAPLLGCGDRTQEARQARTEPGGGSGPLDAAPPVAPATEVDADVLEPGDGPDAAPLDEPGGDLDEGAEAVGAISVWHAVVDRDRYLARRGQRALLAGRVGGDAIAPGARGVVRWLVDESEGNGALAIRMAVSGKPPDDGARVVVAGAWMLDDQRRWYWQAESISPLGGPAPEAPPDPPAAPGHLIQKGPPPAGNRPISKARDGGVVTFGVIKSPRGEGDGWLVGDDSFSPPIAYLYLPGERPSYGGHELRQPDERWVLKRGVTYWVRIGRVRRRTPTDLARIKATTAPGTM
jgi:hypothetical protein